MKKSCSTFLFPSASMVLIGLLLATGASANITSNIKDGVNQLNQNIQEAGTALSSSLWDTISSTTLKGINSLSNKLCQRPKGTAAKNEYVVLIVGIDPTHIAITSTALKPLGCMLQSKGYDIINIDYPSYSKPVQDLIPITAKKYRQAIPLNNRSRKVHFVGYSLGGIMVEGILYNPSYKPQTVGNVVLWGTPNKGTMLGTVLLENNTTKPIFKPMLGPAGQQLTTIDAPQALKGLIDPTQTCQMYNCGVIVGKTDNPITLKLFNNQPNDDLTTVESVKIPNAKMLVLDGVNHAQYFSNPTTLKQTTYFIMNGKFK